MPTGTFTVLTVVVILWLTLGQPPSPENSIELWEHTDKIVHAIMFGGLYYVIMLDYYRHNVDKKPAIINKHSLLFALICISFGGIIEIVQPHFERSADLLDFVADCAGVTIALCVTPFLIPRFKSTFANKK